MRLPRSSHHSLLLDFLIAHTFCRNFDTIRATSKTGVSKSQNSLYIVGPYHPTYAGRGDGSAVLGNDVRLAVVKIKFSKQKIHDKKQQHPQL